MERRNKWNNLIATITLWFLVRFMLKMLLFGLTLCYEWHTKTAHQLQIEWMFILVRTFIAQSRYRWQKKMFCLRCCCCRCWHRYIDSRFSFFIIEPLKKFHFWRVVQQIIFSVSFCIITFDSGILFVQISNAHCTCFHNIIGAHFWT